MNYGEIITLGRHRLMCGDATNREDVYRLLDGQKVNLVLTDPPYGIRIQSKDGAVGGARHITMPGKEKGQFNYNRTNPIQPRQYPQMIGDNTTNAARKHYEIIKELCSKMIIWGGQNFTDFLPISKGWLWWDKLTGNNDFGDGEMAWTTCCKKIKKYTHLWNGACRAGTYKLELRKRVHPTQKPVELHINILEDFTQPDDVILDCFGGSGTTLIAAEMAGRTCYMMEISPEYCEIIAERYYKLKEDYPLISNS